MQAAKDATLIPLSFNGEAIDQNLADLILHDQPDVLQILKFAPSLLARGSGLATLLSLVSLLVNWLGSSWLWLCRVIFFYVPTRTLVVVVRY